MTKSLIKLNEYFVIQTDREGNEVEVIYNPPLLAESQNIRVELRKEKNHSRPHIHIIKKGRGKVYDVSVAIDNLEILAGESKVRIFGVKEYGYILDFILNNQEILVKIYKNLRGDL